MKNNIEVKIHQMATCGVDGDTFERIQKTFEVFTTTATDTDLILDATAFDDQSEELFRLLADIIGEEAATTCAGLYALFYVE